MDEIDAVIFEKIAECLKNVSTRLKLLEDKVAILEAQVHRLWYGPARSEQGKEVK